MDIVTSFALINDVWTFFFVGSVMPIISIKTTKKKEKIKIPKWGKAKDVWNNNKWKEEKKNIYEYIRGINNLQYYLKSVFYSNSADNHHHGILITVTKGEEKKKPILNCLHAKCASLFSLLFSYDAFCVVVNEFLDFFFFKKKFSRSSS